MTQNGSTRADFGPGKTLAQRFHIERLLGEGGFAKSWLARDRNLDDLRVLKEFKSNVSFSAIQDEFNAAKNLSHDRCARVWDLLTTPSPYLVVEYVQGLNLSEFSLDGLTSEECRQCALDALEALAYMHSHSYLHRDISPRNIIVSDERRATLIDFGLAREEDGAASVVGTPPYIAPEVAANGLWSVQADLYSLGASLLHCLVGRLPYLKTEAKHDKLTLVPLTPVEKDKLGDDGTAIAEKLFDLVQPSPSERPKSAAQFAEELKLVIGFRPEVGTEKVNPTVDSLRRLYRGSALGNAGNRGMNDQFAIDTYIPTLLDTTLTEHLLSGSLDLAILTGNPGDGKTSYLVEFRSRLNEHGATELEDNPAGWRVELNGRTFAAVYDASEARGGLTSDEIVTMAMEPSQLDTPHTALLAVNDGRLHQFFRDYSDLYGDQYREIQNQMDGNPSPGSRIALVDLKRRSLAPVVGDPVGLAGRAIEALTKTEFWEVCSGCSARGVCPILRNRETLAGPGGVAVLELVTISHLKRQRRATFRDFRSAIGWLITGDRGCSEVHSAAQDNIDLRRSDNSLAFDLAFDSESQDYLVQEWAAIDPAGLPAASLERAERAGDLRFESWHRRESLNRRAFFSDTSDHELARGETVAYRYLDDFRRALTSDEAAERLLPRLLLGLSRLLGAFGYSGDNLAIGDGQHEGWAVLREVERSDFELARVGFGSEYVEQQADSLRLTHPYASLVLTLDAAELTLRAADGELVGDTASQVLKLELALMAEQLRTHPASSVLVVNPAGRDSRVTMSDGTIRLGGES